MGEGLVGQVGGGGGGGGSHRSLRTSVAALRCGGTGA